MHRESISGTIRRFFFVIALLASVLGFFYLFENWRGKRAWDNYSREMLAQGERLDWESYVADPVPDAQNFIATPLLEAIVYKGRADASVWDKFENHALAKYTFSCNGWEEGQPLDLPDCHVFLRDATSDAAHTMPEPTRDRASAGQAEGLTTSNREFDADRELAAAAILQAFSNLDAEFSELRQASQRPFAQFRQIRPDGELPSFAVIRKLSYFLALRCSAELALHQTSEAFADAVVIQRLTLASQAEPYLVGTMVGCALLSSMGLQTFWEGLSAGQWTDAQLRQFQAFFESINLPLAFDRAMRGGERAGLGYVVRQQSQGGLSELFDRGNSGGSALRLAERLFYRAWPRGWAYQNLVYHHRLLQRTAFANYDVARQRVFPDKCLESAATLDQSISPWNPFSHLAAVGIPNFIRAIQTMARAQSSANQAALACALERYRRARGEYPPNLGTLIPTFIDSLPHDLITGEPMKYQRLAPGKYQLYCVGWDGVDDSGTAAASSGTGQGNWPCPITAAPL